MNKLIKQAFTLIELLVVIAIVGILSGLIVISMGGITEKANIAKSQIFSNSLRNSLLLNLISEWKFDSVTDYNETTGFINSTDNNIPNSWGPAHGKAYGGPILKNSTDCVSGKCVSFDGINDSIGITSITDFNISKTNQLTVELWFKTNIINSTATAIILKSGEWMFYPISSRNLRFLVYDNVSASWRHGTAITDLEANRWYHIVGITNFTTTNLNMKFYMDGVKRGDNNFSSASINTGTGNLTIGSLWGERYNGLIDDVRIYNAIMPSSKIKERYYLGINNLLVNKQLSKEEYNNRISELAINSLD